MDQKVKIDISMRAVFKVLLALLIAWLAYMLRDVILIVFLALILAAAAHPVVENWGKKIGKGFAIFAILIIILLVLAGFVWLIVPPFVSEIKLLASNLPEYADRFALLRSNMPIIEKAINTLTSSIGSITGGLVAATTSVLSGIVTFFTVIILMIYILADQKVLTDLLHAFVPAQKREDTRIIIEKLSEKIGAWFRGQLTLMFIIGILSYVGLRIIGLKYALVLAVVSGLFEIVPVIGPIAAGVLSALVALAISPIAAIIVLVFYVILQQTENAVIVPKIMQKAVGLPAPIILIAILIGGKLLGIIGALLAVPVAASFYVIFREWETIKRILSR